MTVDQAILLLKRIKKDHGGDLEVVSFSGNDKGDLLIEYGRGFEILEVSFEPNPDDMKTVCAFLQPDDAAGGSHLNH